MIGPESWGRLFLRKSLRRSEKSSNFALRNEENYLMTGKMKLYKCQFEPTERWLGCNCSLQSQEVLDKTMAEDFRGENIVVLTNTKEDKFYYHRHVLEPQLGAYFMLVANTRVTRVANGTFGEKFFVDHPYLYVIIVPTKDQSLVLIEECPTCKHASSEVAKTLCHSLNIIFKGYGWKMKLIPCEGCAEYEQCVSFLANLIVDDTEKLHTLEALGEYNVELKRKENKQTSFRDYVVIGLEDRVTEWIRNEIRTATEPIDMMRPMRAFAKLLCFKSRPPIEVFKAEFGKEGMLSLSSYNGYMYTDNDKCSNDPIYDNTIERIKEEFGDSLPQKK